MALDSANETFDPFPRADGLERVPDSSPLRVSLNTQHESGIPPARLRQERALEGSDESLQMALAGVSRTEANLSQLVRGLKHLAAGAAAAQEANTELLHELDELRTHLARREEEELAVRYRATQLEQLLDICRHESAGERQFLIEQQDLFLVEIITDHERQIGELRRALLEASTRRSDPHEIAELIAQRDLAREYATRCERERDLAWQELATGATLVPTPTPTSSKSGAAAIGSISLRAVQVPASKVADTERVETGYSLRRDEIAD